MTVSPTATANWSMASSEKRGFGGLVTPKTVGLGVPLLRAVCALGRAEAVIPALGRQKRARFSRWKYKDRQ